MFRTFSFDSKNGDGFTGSDAVDLTQINKETKIIEKNDQDERKVVDIKPFEKPNPKTEGKRQIGKMDFTKLSKEIGDRVLEKAYLPQNPFEAKSKFNMLKSLILMFNEKKLNV